MDDRLQLMGQWFFFLEVSVRKFVDFAKMMPGFQELKLHDQTCLIKCNSTHRYFDYSLIKDRMMAR